MSKTRKINFDFFELILRSDNRLNPTQLFSLPESKYQPIVKEGGLITLQNNIQNEHDLYYGSLLFNQMDALPSSYDTKLKKMDTLNLSLSQGLAHTRSFLFDAKTNIVMFESGNRGVTFANFCTFFETAAKVEIESSIVLDPEKILKYNKLDSFSTFEVQIAKVKNGEFFSGEKAIKEITRLADITNSGKLYYKFQSSKDYSLDKSFIRTIVKELTKYKETDEVKKIIVSGKEDDDSTNTTIDLIQNRLKASMDFNIKRNIDAAFVHSKVSRMKELYLSLRPKILSAYKN